MFHFVASVFRTAVASTTADMEMVSQLTILQGSINGFQSFDFLFSRLHRGILWGHIPYRDSKLTHILQPALGGNAKTSIICTLAPEEILTDVALLKRQKLEIEEITQSMRSMH
ncbi:hypothetical protein HYC85_025719 [Camellia sinensis]|uniref:Kinesin motor domain-containing protein n=1 Tax=Camellia sinensis TaxID=4442 RepID=A0A7J7GBS5_CAMSI|nr:hypothetical protein HYC85_025719 [Camellia sinensis]